MSDARSSEQRELSPISRRVFFGRVATRLAKLGVMGAAAASAGQSCDLPIYIDAEYPDYGDGGSYSDWAPYSDYANYGDFGSYTDYVDYRDYSDYSDYSDGCW